MLDNNNTTPSDVQAPAGAGAATAWFTVVLFALANFFSVLDRTILTLLVEPLKAEFGLSDTQIGLLQGATFAVFYSILTLPAGYLADRVNRKRLVSIGISLWSAATLACGMASNFITLLIARATVGVGEASLSPSAYSIFSDLFSRKDLPKAIGVFILGATGGSGGAFMLGAAIYSYAESVGGITFPLLGHFKPWQSVFVAAALPGLLLALIILLTIKEPARLSGGKSDVALSSVFRRLKQHRVVYGSVLGAGALFMMVGYAMLTWSATYLVRQFDLTIAQAGMYFGGIAIVFGSIGPILSGFLVDWFSSRGRQDGPVMLLFFMAIGVVIFATMTYLIPNLVFALVGLSALITFYCGNLALAPTAIQLVTPKRMRGQMSSVYLVTAQLFGLTFGPLLVALTTDYVFGDPQALGMSLFVVVASGAAIAGVLLRLGQQQFRDQSQKIAEQE